MQGFIRLGVVGIALATVLTGCASKPPADSSITEASARRLFVAVLEAIEDIYVRETNPAKLVAAGLEHVEKTYPDTSFYRKENTFIGAVGEQTVYSFTSGAGKGQAEYWAKQVAAALTRLKNAVSKDGSVTLADLTDTFILGITESLDEPTRYVPPTTARLFRKEQRGRSGTLSINLEHNDSGWEVGVVHGADLRRSGKIRRGDLVTAIDGISTANLSESEVTQHLSGPLDTFADLMIRHKRTGEVFKVSLQRKKRWGAESIGFYPEGNAVRVLIANLNEDTVKQLDGRVANTTDETGTISGFILDLRDNPGGLLQSSYETADVFLKEGQILSTHGRHIDSHQEFNAKPSRETNLPLVVLVDEHTAAGAEIAIAALQDSGRALVLGEPTYGRGTIQTVLPLPNIGELILTWSEAHAPSGYRLDKRGVMPTVCTGGDATYETVLAKLRGGDGTIDYITRTRDIDPADEEAIEDFRSLCPARSDDADISLEIARAILEDPQLYRNVLARGGQNTATAE